MVLVKNKLGEEVEFSGTKLKVGEQKNVNIDGYKKTSRILLTPVEGDSTEMTDDYLDQNAKTVRKSLREDDLSDKTLENLLEAEKNDKDRKTVKSQIKKKME